MAFSSARFHAAAKRPAKMSVKPCVLGLNLAQVQPAVSSHAPMILQHAYMEAGQPHLAARVSRASLGRTAR